MMTHLKVQSNRQIGTAMFPDGNLSIAGHSVMEDWEDSYMPELAQIATSNGGVRIQKRGDIYLFFL